MIKSFVLYTIFEIEGELVDCIYFANSQCRAQAVVAGVSRIGESYTPTAEEQKAFCKDGAKFKSCPRYTAYQDHLRAIGLVK